MPTLHELSNDLIDLQAALEDAGDEESREILLSAYLETEQDVKKKLDGYACLISEIEARASARKAEAMRMMDLAASDIRIVESMRDRMLWFFTTHGLDRVETPRYRLTLQNNGGKLPLEISVEPDVLPEHYRKEVTTVLVDKEAIRAALEAGEEVVGCRLGERSRRVAIR